VWRSFVWGSGRFFRACRRGARRVFAKSMVFLAGIAAYAGNARTHHGKNGMSQLHTATCAIGVNVFAHFMNMKRRHRK